MTTNLEQILPERRVLDAARDFLDKTGWNVEPGRPIPRDARLEVVSRHAIPRTQPPVYEVCVMVGAERMGKSWAGRYCALTLRFDASGRVMWPDETN